MQIKPVNIYKYKTILIFISTSGDKQSESTSLTGKNCHLIKYIQQYMTMA